MGVGESSIGAGGVVGVALSRNRESTFYDLLEAADKAMYAGKTPGRETYTILGMGQERLGAFSALPVQ